MLDPRPRGLVEDAGGGDPLRVKTQLGLEPLARRGAAEGEAALLQFDRETVRAEQAGERLALVPGKFQVTCTVTADYEIEATEEYWDCDRRIRYSAEKKAWHLHRKFVSHTHFLGPWTCEPHHKRPRY